MAAVASTPSPAVTPPMPSPPSSSSSASPQTLNPTVDPLIHHISFNQDASCFSVSSSSAAPSPSSSFKVFSTDPFLLLFHRSFPDDDASSGGGGFLHVTMLFRSNILAVVFAGTPNKVMIWDEHQGGFIGELSFRSDVKSVKLRRDRIVVVVHQKVFVYNFADLRLLNQVDRPFNLG